MNEYDEQQIRSLSQRDQAFEDDFANLNPELTQNSSFLALEQSEMYLWSSVKAFPLNDPEFLVHDDSDMMLLGEDPLGQRTQKYDDDGFPIDDEGIEEILKLAELKQENEYVSFHRVFERNLALLTTTASSIDLITPQLRASKPPRIAKLFNLSL